MTDALRRLVQPGLAAVPVYVLSVAAVLLALPLTREAAVWSLAENRPVELLTFMFLVAGGWVGLRLAAGLRQRGAAWWAVGFYALFAVGLLVIAAEEVAWGQWFLGFETPEAVGAVNTQGELTLHNHVAFNDHLEAFPLVFGMAGLVSVWLASSARWAVLGSPSVLASWFAVIAVVSAVDFVQDFYVLQADFDALINHLDEVVEMLVGVSGFLYVHLNAKALLPRVPQRDAAGVPRIVVPAGP